MSFEDIAGQVSKISDELRKEQSVSAAMRTAARLIGAVLHATSVTIEWCQTRATWQGDARSSKMPQGGRTWCSPEGIRMGAASVLTPLYLTRGAQSLESLGLRGELEAKGVGAIAILSLMRGDDICGFIEVDSVTVREWRPQERLLLECVAAVIVSVIERVEAPQSSDEIPTKLEEVRLQYKRLVDYGNLLIVRTDVSMALVDVVGDTWRLLGISPAQLVRDPSVWTRLVPEEDLARLGRRVRRMLVKPGDLSIEIRLKHQRKGTYSWFLIRGIPLYSAAGIYLGWEGLALDVSERRRSRHELRRQSKRVEALYQVSRALTGKSDPAFVTLTGLRALLRATGSDCGLGCFYGEPPGKIDLVAAAGLSEEYLQKVQEILDGRSLVRYSIEHNEGLLLANLQRDPRAAVELAKREGLTSCIVMPLAVDDQVFGAIALFCRQEGRYDSEDFELVKAAARQIALAAQQAKFIVQQRDHAAAISVLYRLSHELSKYFSPAEISEHSFPIIQSEVPCRRMWLGLINDQGTHLIGQAGMGPGVRKSIVDLHLSLEGRSDAIEAAIRTRQPVVLHDRREMVCSGLDRIMDRLAPSCVVIVPLVSIWQVVGVLVVEPEAAPGFFAQHRLPLLTSMANEIASVLLARRFESRLAEANKMRMAGVLAAGVAHNFNNLLQAVMGQASIIEMQSAPQSTSAESAKKIVAAATKGAGLIRQLLTLAKDEPLRRTPLDVTQILNEGRDLYRSIVGSTVDLSLDIADGLRVSGDGPQLQHVITNLLVNAKEAIDGSAQGKIEIQARSVRLASGEVDPHLPPGRYVRIDVTDNGPGMDEERRSRCFEPFFTTKNVDATTGLSFDGSGLGLTSAYSIVRQHNGVIVVQSEVEKGSTFTVYLPHIGGTLTESVERAERLESNRPHVIIFDVEEAYTRSIQTAVESLGLRVTVAYQRDAVRTVLSRQRGQRGILVIDVDRSGYDTVGFIRSIQAHEPHCTLVLITNDQGRWEKHLSNKEGVEIVSKPAGVWSIHAAVQRILQTLEAPSGEEVSTRIDSSAVSTSSLSEQIH